MLNWWDDENEMLQRVSVRPVDATMDWRRATGGESACVWDLKVIAFEHDAYVRRVLSHTGGPDVGGYAVAQM